MKSIIKRILTVAIILIIAASSVLPAFAADSKSVTTIKAVKINDTDDYNENTKMVKTKFNLVSNNKSRKVFKFSLSKKSVVILDLKASDAKLKGSYSIYRNKNMTDEVFSFSNSTDLFNGTKGVQEVLTLGKGTYYVEVSVANAQLFGAKDRSIVLKQGIAFMSVSKAVQYDYTVMSDDSVILKINSPIKELIDTWCVEYSADANTIVTAKDSIGIDGKTELSVKKLKKTNNQVLVKGIISGNSYSWGNQGFVRVIKLDLDAPAVKGAADNGLYKSSIDSVTVSDASGVASIVLDGVSVKSGFSVNEKGVHELVVSDKKGNKKVMKFLIV